MIERMIKRILTCFLVTTSLATSAQVDYPLNTVLADSLEALLPTAKEEHRVDLLNGMSYALIRHYSNRSDSLANLSLDLSRKLGYKKGLAMALFCKGTNLYLQGEFIKALSLLQESVDLYKELGDTMMIIDACYQMGGIIYFSLTDMPEGLRLVQECLHYARASGNRLKEAQMYSSLQFLWGTIGLDDSTLKYLDLYRSVARDIPVRPLEAALVEGAYGWCYAKKGDLRRAMDQFLHVGRMLDPETVEGRASLSQLYAHNGNVYLKMGMLDSARFYYHSGMVLAQKNRHYYGLLENGMGLARYYFQQKDPLRALKYCDSVIFYGLKIDSSGSFFGIPKYSKLMALGAELYIPLTSGYKRYIAWGFMHQAYQLKIRIFESQGRYKEAFLTDKTCSAINDSIVGFQKRKEILDLEYKYQTGQKDDQITMLYQQNQLQSLKLNQNRLILFSVIGMGVLSVLVMFLLIRQNRARAREQVAEFRQKLLRSQMNPHFIFNSLTSIQHFILKQDAIKASIYLSRFSGLVRSILSHSLAEEITLEEELETMENYLVLQQVRFPDKFDFVIEVDPALDTEHFLIPPMLTQPFIENAIEHGIKPMKAQGKISIKIWHEKDYLVIEILDNGVGRKKAQELLKKHDPTHQSLATKLTAERISVLNKKLKKRKITFEITDLKDETGNATGTLVRFGILAKT
ncbi:MAG: histidine kinase [Bacteroidales bacterium]|nr:histidine kinase [Bacteroidales bacterium]